MLYPLNASYLRAFLTLDIRLPQTHWRMPMEITCATAWITMVVAHKEGIINGVRLPMAFSIKFANETPYTIFNVGC